ncbi:MAG: hypothetical protein QOD56_1896 [Gammaproteobacteria bacterium]|nr:hypothetical protein [Gammaproteobacteria bacterium]
MVQRDRNRVRFLACARQDNPNVTHESCSLYLAHCIEDETVAKSVIGKFVTNSESVLNTDSAIAYGDQNKNFVEHGTVNHTIELVGPNGENNNLAEELNFRYDRAEGVFI